jgi:hypothetical protein
MGQNSSEITRDIRQTRAELGSNLQELENKVKELADWREQFQKNPFLMIGLAVGGGLLLSSLGERRARVSYGERWGSERNGGPGLSEMESDRATRRQMRRASDTWDTIKGALIGVAATRAQGFLRELVPGFAEEFKKVQEREHPQLAGATAQNTPA